MPERTSDAQRRDEAGSDRDREADHRDDDGDARDVAGTRRDEASEDRDAVSGQRDFAAEERDAAAAERDRLAESDDAGDDPPSPIAQVRAAAARRAAAADRDASKRDRTAGASDRTQSGQDRNTSTADREASADNRSRAGRDRHTALADRDSSADERHSAALDSLTAAHTRQAGLLELGREIARSRRTGDTFTVAFVDIDQLKSVNDSDGHSAGDRLIVRVADCLRAELREYDLTIRYGGDEFLCVIRGLDMASARTRMDAVNDTLAVSDGGGSVSVGLAQLISGDTAAQLIERADQAMYRGRDLRRQSGN